MEKLKIDSGLKSYEIEDENGRKLGVITIDPKDMNLLARCQTAEKKITELIEKASHIADSEDIEQKEVIEKITEIDTEIKKELDYAFDSEVSFVVFGNRHCMNTNRGKTFVERFLDMMLPVIEKETKQERDASNARIKKYTEQYKNPILSGQNKQQRRNKPQKNKSRGKN